MNQSVSQSEATAEATEAAHRGATRRVFEAVTSVDSWWILCGICVPDISAGESVKLVRIPVHNAIYHSRQLLAT